MLQAAGGLHYRAQWDELELLGEDGGVDGTISATSYVVPSETGRPVTFLWNGGPGASSSPLHLNAFGPRILRDGVPVVNDATLLDVSDLVFVDPVGTGFSRIRREDAVARLLTVPGDAAAVEALIRGWLERNDRLDASVHLVGESFGGYRLAAVAPNLGDLHLDGVTLVSPLLDPTAANETPGNDLPAVFQLPTMAVAAWAHGRASAGVDDVRAVWAAAERFAASELLPGLHRGSALEPAERVRLAARIAEFIGLPLDDVLDADLRVDSEEFLRALRRDEGLLVGRLDVRVTGPLPEPHPEGRAPAADDPSLGIGRSNVIHSAPIAAHLREELGAPSDDEPYVSLSLDLNFAWDWRPQHRTPAAFSASLSHNLGALHARRPDARFLLLGGYFDLATTLSSTVHAMRHSGVPADRFAFHPLIAGHAIDATVLSEAHDAIADLIRLPFQTGRKR